MDAGRAYGDNVLFILTRMSDSIDRSDSFVLSPHPVQRMRRVHEEDGIPYRKDREFIVLRRNFDLSSFFRIGEGVFRFVSSKTSKDDKIVIEKLERSFLTLLRRWDEWRIIFVSSLYFLHADRVWF